MNKYGKLISYVAAVSALSGALLACQSTPEQYQVAVPSVIIKSDNDKRSYRSIILDNELEIVLVSDPSIEKSAAALSVAVGSFQEPAQFGGLAHYLEHMLFLGTKSYPNAGEYTDFISRNGGTQNAYTQLDHTNYMVAVNNDAYAEALARFAGFFYEPILDPSYADKERNAVHSEWTMKGPSDYVILGQLDGLTLNPEHPISQFNWGNLESLSDKGEQRLHDVLVDFYQQYYSANLMKGAMISNLPLAEMEQLAKVYFGKIPNKQVPRPTINVEVQTPAQATKLVRYTPQTDMKQIQVKFAIDNNAAQFTVKPNRYLAYLVGSEMPGTLAAELRAAGLAEYIYAMPSADEYGNAGSFTIYIGLTESGLSQRDAIVGAVFDYIALVKEKGVDAKYFQEIKQSLSNAFQFKEKSNDYNYAMQIAADLQKVPTPYVLSANYQYDRFDADAVQQVLSQLTLANARVFYIDKGQATNSKMHFFKGEYQVENITAELQQQWAAAAKRFDLRLPAPNQLMPEHFNLVTKTLTDQPKTLVQEPGLSVYLMHSAQFDQPKGSFTANFNTGFGKQSARRQAMTQLLADGLYQQLTTLMSEASAAGMGFNVSTYNGLVFSASGFTDKQSALLQKGYQQLLAYRMTDAELANYKAALQSRIISKTKRPLLNQLFPKFSDMVQLDAFSDQAVLAELPTITVAEVMAFSEQILQRAKLNVFAFGNYSEQQVVEMARALERELPADRQLAETYFTPRLMPAPGTVLNWQENSELTDIALLDILIAPLDERQYASAKILSQMIRPAMFNQLRTEEQLAYSVGFFTQQLREQMQFGFYIQSPANGVDAIFQRIEAFKQQFVEKLKATTVEEFETVRNSVLVTLTQPPKNLAEEASPYLQDWRNYRLSFDSKAQHIKAIEQVTLAEVQTLYQQVVATDDFARVLVQLRGVNYQQQPFVSLAGEQLVTDTDQFHQLQQK